MKAGNAISIHYKWTRYYGIDPDIQTVEAETDINAGSISPEAFLALQREVKDRGFFDWRTWTHNYQNKQATYSVNLLNNEYNDLPCSHDTAATECKIRIKISN